MSQHRFCWLVPLCFLLASPSLPAAPSREALRDALRDTLSAMVPDAVGGPAPHWIWAQRTADGQACWFRRDLVIPGDSGGALSSAALYAAWDDSAQVFVNGKPVSLRPTSPRPWSLHAARIAGLLKPGTNTIAAACRNSIGPAGFIAIVEARTGAGSSRLITDGAWKVSETEPSGWPAPPVNGGAWAEALVLGPAGMPPWGATEGYPAAWIPTPPAGLDAETQIAFDWLLQDRRELLRGVGGSPGDRDGALLSLAGKHLETARELMDELAATTALDLAPRRARLKDFEAVLASRPRSADGLELYLRVRGLRREVFFLNPLIDFSEILFVKGPYPGSLHEQSHRLGFAAVPGGGLFVLRGLSPAGSLREVTAGALPRGSYWRPDLSFDARRVLFCYKPAGGPAFHLYEVGVDGAGLRQLSDGPFDDLDPIHLPGGKIIFTSTRGQTYVRCNPESRSFVLCRCEGDGSRVSIISNNSEPDWTPALLSDGRVLFTRWEYTDRALWRLQKLWTVRPDGSGVELFWGNHSEKPDCLVEAREIPGTRKVVFCGVGHHQFFQGSLGILDPSRGLDFPAGLEPLTPDVAWPEVEPDRDAGAYKSPYPLGEGLFLVSHGHDSNAYRPGGADFGIYVLDARGRKELVYRDPELNSWYSVPVRPRVPPPDLPDASHGALISSAAAPGAGAPSSAVPGAEGIFFNPDVHEGLGGVPRGAARHLQVIEADYKTYSGGREFLFQCPPISVHFAESVKRVWGTVPVEEDGSVCFRAPAGRALYFQLLDEGYRAIHTMRSFVGLQPGEVRGCTGCHATEHRSPPASSLPAIALRKPPAAISPPPWGEETVSYPRFVQPVLDAHCVSCHAPGEEAGKKLDLTFRKTRFFAEPYETLIAREIALVFPSEPAYWGDRARDVYSVARPYEYLSVRSPLVEYAASGKHHDVRVDPDGLRRLCAWVDANGPYLGREEVLERFPDASISRRP